MIYHPFRHLGLKALSVALAVLVWLSVSGEPIVERTVLVPLELQNLSDGLQTVGETPETVAVRVRGGSGILSHLAQGDVVAVLELSAARPGRRFVPLTLDRIRTPVGVQAMDVTPSTLLLDIERSVTRSVKVEPQIEGEPAPGFAKGSVRCQPEDAAVVGPSTLFVGRHQLHVITEPISIAGARAPIIDTVALAVSVPGLRLTTPGRATVTVDIRPVPVERAIPGVTIQSRNLSASRAAIITPSQAIVTVRGAATALEGLTAERFPAFVDLAGLRPGRYNLRVQVDPPPNVEIVQIQPASVGVSIK